MRKQILVAVLLAVTFPLTASAFNGYFKPALYTIHGVKTTDGSVSVVVNRVSNIGGNDSASLSYKTIDAPNSPIKPGTGFTPTAGVLAYGPGETSKSFSVGIVDDGVYTHSTFPKSFWVELSNPTNDYALRASDGSEGGGNVSITVEIFVSEGNPQPAVSWSQANYTVTEGSGTLPASLVRTQNTNGSLSVSWQFRDPSLAEVAVGTVVFASGETSKPINAQVPNDFAVTGNRTFHLYIVPPVNFTFATTNDHATVQVVEDDVANTPPAFSISDATIGESNGSLSFLLSITPVERTQPASVTYTTSNGTAHHGQDYTATSGTVTFPAGPLEGGAIGTTISVTVKNNAFKEPTETMTITLSNPVNATISDGTGIGTIVDDDTHPSLFTISDVLVGEGDDGMQTMTFTITRDGDVAGPDSVRTTIHGMTADATDYSGDRSEVLDFGPGETVRTIDVMVAGDRFHEGDDVITAQLSAPQTAGLAQDHATGTIANDDPAPVMRISDGVVNGNNVVFTVTLSEASGLPAIVRFSTRDDTAVAGVDYAASNGILVLEAGRLNKTISVPLMKAPTAARAFKVQLTGASNTTVEDNEAVALLAPPPSRRRASGR